MKLVVLGAEGQLGSELVREGETRGWSVEGYGREKLDATSAEEVLRVLAAARADAVVNCVAYTNVDKAEDEPASAFAANATAAMHVAKAARAAGSRLLLTSTTFVFDGAKAGDYDESDAPRPLGVYAASKLAGEHLTLAHHPDACVARLSGVFGVKGARGKPIGNFVDAFAKKALANEDMRIIADQTLSFSHAGDLAGALCDLAALPSLPPLVHVANEGRGTWHDAAVHIARRVGSSSKVEPVPTGAFPQKARRPANSAMSTRLFASLVGRRLRPWREAIDAYLVEKQHVRA